MPDDQYCNYGKLRNTSLAITFVFIYQLHPINPFLTLINQSLGCVAQSVTCLATDACLTADPGVGKSFPAWSHTFMEIDHEIISTVILLPSTESFKKGCCQLQTKVCARSTGQLLVQACSRKSVVRWTDRPAMTIAIDLGHKAPRQTQKKTLSIRFYLSKQCRHWWNVYLWSISSVTLIFTVFQSTCLLVSKMKRVKIYDRSLAFQSIQWN